MKIIALVVALVRAIPIINKWVELIVIEYTRQRQEQLIKLNKKLINESIKNKDQREIESSSYSGKPSGYGDIVESLPRLRNKTKN